MFKWRSWVTYSSKRRWFRRDGLLLDDLTNENEKKPAKKPFIIIDHKSCVWMKGLTL